ncbi:MAG: tripartite tricarboxylate transporter permease [Candidatus Diapherotrites archaeon]|nr:tripartite tricarboxylate transporter permease [Candidatus Diapherotrites archaeon]
MESNSIALVLAGCFLGIFTGLVPGIHVNTIAALSTINPENNFLGLALMICAMSIVHSFVDFIPAIFFGCPEESNYLSVLPGHRMLLKGKGIEAITLAAAGAFFSGLIAILMGIVFLSFLEKTSDLLYKIIPFVLVFVLGSMVFSEKGAKKKFFAIGIIFASGLLAHLVLGPKSSVENALFVCITGFFGASTIIESLRKKSFFPEQKQSKFRIRKEVLFEGSLLGLGAGALVAVVPAIGANQAAFVLRKIFGNIGTKKFLVLLGGSGTANMFLGFLMWFALGKTRSGSAVAISQLIEATAENIVWISLACFFALGFGFIATMLLAKKIAVHMKKIDYKKANKAILLLLIALVFLLSNPTGLIAFATSTAIGLTAIFNGVKRTHCMAFLMIPTLMYYFGF